MLTYKPHKGEFHSKAIGNDTYLFVAASHHCLPTRRSKKYGCEGVTDPSTCLMEQYKDNFYCKAFNNKLCPLHETCNDKDEYCTERKKLICETKLCIYDHVTDKTESNPIFSDFYEFRKKLIEEGILVVKEGEDRHSLWSKVCFQNYIQTITTNSDSDQNVIEEKYLNLRGVKVVKGKEVRCNINVEAFKENCKDIEPDVIVVLHYKDIKNKIKEISQKKINKKTFKPILQLSEENRFYVFAHTESNLYKRFNNSLLSAYKDFKPKGFTESIIAVAIIYHILNKEGEVENIKRRSEIFDKIVKEYNWSLNKKSFNKGFNHMKGYMKDYMKKKETHGQSETLKCYAELEKRFKQE